MNTPSPATIERLIKLASRAAYVDDPDDFCPYDIGGGNHDDTFWAGNRDGETLLARDILTEMGVPFTIET